jgi:protein-arginine kinase
MPEELVETCDRLFMETQPAHLQWDAGSKLEPDARDIMRGANDPGSVAFRPSPCY